jgi:hypothetical protein
MNTWMRRRIERSRARCEKAAASYKSDKGRAQEAKPRQDRQAESTPSS